MAQRASSASPRRTGPAAARAAAAGAARAVVPADLRAGMVLRAESGFFTVGPLPPRVAAAVAAKEHEPEEEGGPARAWGPLSIHPELVLGCAPLQEPARCVLAGRLKRGERTATNPLAIGDCVAVRLEGRAAGNTAHIVDGTVEGRAARYTELARQAAGDNEQKHVLAANLAVMVVVTALRKPPPNRPRLDRFLVAAEEGGMRAVICATKADLGEPGEAEELFAPYPPVGYPVISTSALTGLGLAELRAALGDGLSAVVGVSGVGKSRLLTALQPGLTLRYAALSDSTGKGRHTTTTAELIPLSGGGYVADTPGLRAIAPWDVLPAELALLFPEMRPYVGTCRFSTCSHRHEPGCAVRAALAAGRIDPGRYDSYVKLHQEAEAEKAARYR